MISIQSEALERRKASGGTGGRFGPPVYARLEAGRSRLDPQAFLDSTRCRSLHHRTTIGRILAAQSRRQWHPAKSVRQGRPITPEMPWQRHNKRLRFDL